MRIELQPPDWATHLLSDLTDWRKDPLPVSRLEPFTIPDDAYFEYAYRDQAGELRADPDNTAPRLNPWWPQACHIAGPEYRPDPLAELPSRRPAGRVLRLDLDSRLLGQKRRLLIYSPPGCADRPLTHVVFQDGKAYFGWGKVCQMLDHLLERQEVVPGHLVFVPPVQRTREYAFNPRYRQFIVEEILQEARARAPRSGRCVAWGASLGGLLSAQLAWEHPDLFGKVVSQSGAFLFSEDMELDNPFAGNEGFRRQVLQEDPRDVLWHLDCGTLEWLATANRNLEASLRSRGHDVSLSFRNAGHNWVNWRNGIAAGLRFALGG